MVAVSWACVHRCGLATGELDVAGVELAADELEADELAADELTADELEAAPDGSPALVPVEEHALAVSPPSRSKTATIQMRLIYQVYPLNALITGQSVTPEFRLSHGGPCRPIPATIRACIT
jgi:hypothetical protein